MKIIVFGASGGTGRELIKQAVADGHQVSAFVRSRAKLGSDYPSVNVYEGDIEDSASVAAAVRPHFAVLSALGAASPFRPYPAFLRGVRNILSGLEQAAGRRIVYLSFVGVPESRDQFGFLGQHVIAPLVLRHATEGHRQNEAAIRESASEWTIVRAAKLTNGARTSKYRAGERLAPRGLVPTISRADVAELMLRQLDDPSHLRRSITVMQ